MLEIIIASRFCDDIFLVNKCLDSGKFTWPKVDEKQSISITKAQLSMLIEGIDWRNPRWSNRPEYIG
ncbi:IS66 family insertion sequence element accessory protein TnpB [Rickettsia asembonensis]|uniref:IS66 family insertion sequence element accessory protein TnpB n=1 Tax=Rickettsia asembonensis TaxID=1068590 RepID=UPI0023F93B4C|nr:IS66 family insertion sequence element accessory protein TnpB [Rickettsia asembonensis]WCR55962.1 MAG: hypothetical protein PG979_000019 [Rickettsia asembonensis]